MTVINPLAENNDLLNSLGRFISAIISKKYDWPWNAKMMLPKFPKNWMGKSGPLPPTGQRSADETWENAPSFGYSASETKERMRLAIRVTMPTKASRDMWWKVRIWIAGKIVSAAMTERMTWQMPLLASSARTA